MLFFIFILTVIIRVPQLIRPLSKHHELNTAAVLVCLQVWNEQGPAPSKAAPVQYFPGKYNIFYDAKSSFKNLNNSGAYLSMGAGSYLLPWLVMKLFHLAPSSLSLRLWMLLLEVITVYLLYGLLLFIKTQLFPAYKNFAFTGCLLFLTAPVVMWFMGNSYSHESMVMPFYLLMLRLAFAILVNDYRWNTKYFLWYGLCTTLAVYTDWLGLMAAAIIFIQAVSFKNFKQRIPFLLTNLLAVFIPVIIVCWQYISLVGWKEYSGFIVAQLHRRSLPGTDVEFSIVDFTKYFVTGYGALCIAALLGIILIRKKVNSNLVLLAAIPLLHYLVFRGFSNEHDYSVLKWSPFMIVAALAGLGRLSQKIGKESIAAYSSSLITSVLLYHFINPPFAKSFNGEQYMPG